MIFSLKHSLASENKLTMNLLYTSLSQLSQQAIRRVPITRPVQDCELIS